MTDLVLDYDFDARWWTGPIDKIEKRLARISDDTNGLAVLVTTGAFCPIHQGHVQLLETAKRELESRGMAVLGGYICPDHDDYVSSKIRSGSLSAAQRLELCELAVEESDWLMVDRWAAIYASSAVGFTTIVGHIDKMIKQHIKTTKPIHIVYTFGGDNAAFAFSFVARWSCVCVLRPGSQGSFNDMATYGSLRKNPRIIFSHDATDPLDSTSVRKGDLSGLLPKVKDKYLTMQRARSETFVARDPATSPSTDTFYIRNEELLAIRPFLQNPKCNADRLLKAYDMFCEGLQLAFVLAFDFGTTIESIRLQDQQTELDLLLAKHEGVISIDPCLSGSHNLRIWHVSKPLAKASTALIAPPEQTPPEKHLSQAKAGSYVLLAEHLPLDAGTERLLTEQLPNDCIISRYMSHSDLISSDVAIIPGTQSSTTINARDFLAGSYEGGTMLQLSEPHLVRAPNMIPYVRPSHRAHMDVTVEVGFSRAVWELNRRFFQAVEGGLTVRDMAAGFQALCEIQGFPANMGMTELCDWHLTAFGDMDFDEL
jgi:nicotinic acid mononucleotide adenylyltransferase